MQSNQAIAPLEGQIGDPAMLVIPPTAQFQHRYLFAVPKGYQENYLTVVGRSGYWKLDGESIALGKKKQLGVLSGVMFYYARVEVEEGSQTVESSTPVGVTVNGLDMAVSYGFPAGVGLNILSETPPIL